MHISSLVSILKPDANALILKKFIKIVKFSYRNIVSEERFNP